MTGSGLSTDDLAQRLAQAEATISALLSDQVDAVIDSVDGQPVLLRKAQEALRLSEERYRGIVETANEGIYIVDTDLHFIFANRRAGELFGIPSAELIGRPLFDFVPAFFREATERRVALARLGAPAENEVAFLRRDGTEFWALLKTTPMHDSDGCYLGNLAMITDRTHRRQADESLRASEAQYRQIVESTSDGIIKVDANAEITYVNGRFASMLGYEPHELVGRSLFALLTPDMAAFAAISLEKRRGGLTANIDISYLHKDGTEVSVNVAGSPLVDAEGAYVGSLGIVRDLSERNRLQAQLMISDRMASVGTLAAGVAHEINNPLAAVIGNLDYIVQTMRPPRRSGPAGSEPPRSETWILEEIRTPLADAQEAAERVRFVVRDLKLFSRSPEAEPAGAVDVEPIIESSLRMAWNEIRHRAKLIKQFDRVPPVTANAARLGQVFLNLLVNAAQAMPEGRADVNVITVRTRLIDGRVVVDIADTGDGIPPERLGRIFDAFYTTKPAGVGTGLGLAICHRIVTKMGGELTVESTVGKGSVFRVSLPEAEYAERARDLTPQAIPQVRRGRILVVDDEAMVLRVISRVIAMDNEAVSTVSAAEALAMCRAGERFDLILCDLMMPEMTGMELHRELMVGAPEMADRMVFLTGGAFTPQAREFLADGPREYIEKPFDASNLRAVVQRHVRGL